MSLSWFLHLDVFFINSCSSLHDEHYIVRSHTWGDVMMRFSPSSRWNKPQLHIVSVLQWTCHCLCSVCFNELQLAETPESKMTFDPLHSFFLMYRHIRHTQCLRNVAFTVSQTPHRKFLGAQTLHDICNTHSSWFMKRRKRQSKNV